MNILSLLLRPWRRIVDFSGRSRRTEFVLFYAVFWVVVAGLTKAAEAALVADKQSVLGPLLAGGGLLFVLASLLPALALTVRRIHDQNRTALVLLLCLIPGFNVLMFLAVAFLSGTDGPNNYGEDPRWEDTAAVDTY